jgi:diguanylate cyclase (GGDEF)-like protein
MEHDRRRAGLQDRRISPEASSSDVYSSSRTGVEEGANFLPSDVIRQSVAGREATASLRETVVQSRQNVAFMRENAVLVREQGVQKREDIVHEKEATALGRENAATLRETEVHDSTAIPLEQAQRNMTLQLANEQLVLTAIRLQIETAENEKSKSEMTILARYDFLTSLPNRAQLYDRIDQAIAMAKRHPTKLAVLFLDLDKFKIINDSHGHAIGDKLLQSVAERLKSAVRNTDTVSRLGGDEFVLLLSEVNEDEKLQMKIEEIHSVITAPYSIGGHELHIGATIGVSIFPQDGDNSATLIRNADTAMYFGKKSGRNSYQFYVKEMGASDTERKNIEMGLQQAIQKNEFVLFYQAQFNLENGLISGVEALIRWQHPANGLMLPGGFMSVAESCGAILPIGRWALRTACEQAKLWQEAGLAFSVVAVNISALEFEDEKFLENVLLVLRETGLPPKHLELELTETVLMRSVDATTVTLNKLRSIGVSISIDDFGTGYSSLSYLKQFPVDTMKIDQSFVRDISKSDDDILLNAVIGIGKSLRHRVIAEGVETATQLAFLRENQCTAAQGFYLNEPMPAEDFFTFLKNGVALHAI